MEGYPRPAACRLYLFSLKNGYRAALGGYRNHFYKKCFPVHFPDKRDTGFNRYCHCNCHFSNLYLTMNYNTSNEILTVCEVKISYRPTVKPCERPLLNSSRDIYKFLMENGVFDPSTIQYREFFKMILLNNAMRVLGVSHLSEGSVNQTVVDIRHIMQTAILSNSTGIVLCHNHSSGNLTPSVDDDRATRQIKEACKIFNIFLIDHLIISSENYYSYADEGRLY